MKRLLITSFLFLHFFCACNNNVNDRSDPTLTTESDVDAARNFIRSALDGRYDKAREMVLPDSSNNAWIELAQRNYQSRMSMADKQGYREASITILDVRELNDSATVVSYSNSYKKKNDSVKVVRVNGGWKVDLKYSFAAPTDSLAK